MTREEAIKILQKRQRFCKVISDHANATIKADELQEVEAIDMAISTLRPVSREQLSEYKTCELVEELRKREGIETHIAEPYQDVAVSVNGPAVVLVVID